MRKIIDLSVTVSLKGNLQVKPQIIYRRHEETPKFFSPAIGILPEEFPEGKYCAVEVLTIGTHNTTHLDAPYHFYPTSEGKPAKTIDQIPLEWCYGDGVVLDFHHKKKGYGITPRIWRRRSRIEYTLKPFDIVLIRTDTYKHYDEPGYEFMHPGMTREATIWLLDQGIKVPGTMPGAGTGPSKSMVADLKAGKKSSSGSRTIWERRKSIVTWKDWPTWTRSPALSVLRYRPFRLKSKMPAPGG